MATPKQKKRKNTNKLISRIFLGCAVLGIVLFLSGSLYIWHENTKYSFALIPQNQLDKKINLPIAIDISSINISLPIDEGYVTKNVWNVSNTHANHLSFSASPGESGNIVIYGHNKTSIFGNLGNVQTGNTIILTSANGQKYQYRVTKKFIVSPDQVEVIKSNGKALLTVYTCIGFLDLQRLIIQAEPQT